jgi:hypothetical protein
MFAASQQSRILAEENGAVTDRVDKNSEPRPDAPPCPPSKQALLNLRHGKLVNTTMPAPAQVPERKPWIARLLAQRKLE